jgi:hypothetical protein
MQVLSDALRSRFDTEAHFVSPQVRSMLVPLEPDPTAATPGPDLAE